MQPPEAARCPLAHRVNDDPTGVANDQFNQWLSVDPSDGSVIRDSARPAWACG